jgi:transcriptional regulatory protein LevR
MLPDLDVAAEESPRRAKIKQTAEIKYKNAERLTDTFLSSLLFAFRKHLQHTLSYNKSTKNVN